MVRDDSMRPTLIPGDRLWVDPRPARQGRFARGEIVVARDPDGSGRHLLKRVVGLADDPIGDGRRVPDGSVYLEGDDRERSRDSRTFGPVALDAILAVAWFRYFPADRRGPIGPGTLK